jgi:signal transduction histidine kinase
MGRHNPFFRRLGCLFIVFNLFSAAVFLLIGGLIANALGFLHFSFNNVQLLLPASVLIIALGFFILVRGVFSLRRMSMPLDELLTAADRVAEGDYSARVNEDGPREVRSLARAFNNMASRLYSTDEQRRNLLADVTHELRTPLTVIQGNLEGMLDGVYPADEPNLRALLDETNVLRRLVEDLRTLALAESGALQLRKESTDLAMLIRDTLAAFQSQAESAEIALTFDSDADIPWLNIDPGRMRQVLSNLVANALRYTPHGGSVCVTSKLADDRALITVQDTGSGIAPDDLAHIFERFYKSADSGGMGLGLAIAKHLVDAHGGTITAESPPGEGTIIRIVLPIDA